VSTQSGETAGNVSYRSISHGPPSSRAYQIGITLAPPYRGQGYGAEAQRLLVAYLFATYPIERVEAETDVTNRAEQRALERAGFTREGVLRRAQWRNGSWHDLILYSKLRGE
jgi:RimJ/RimL family protein N-acetyltransferase